MIKIKINNHKFRYSNLIKDFAIIWSFSNYMPFISLQIFPSDALFLMVQKIFVGTFVANNFCAFCNLFICFYISISHSNELSFICFSGDLYIGSLIYYIAWISSFIIIMLTITEGKDCVCYN